ncbi:MAG: hypothetical protein ACI9QC_000575 [Oceanicoccus sp.]|jgi:hypothetical protein
MERRPIQHRDLLLIPQLRIVASVAMATLLSWTGLLLVVNRLDPYTSTSLALTLFFTTSIMTLTGTFGLLLFFFKKWKSDDRIYVKHVMISLRQGFLLSFCTNLCLALLMLGLLRIWNGSLLVVLIMLFEFYLSQRDDLK